MNLFSIYILLVLFILTPRFVGNEDDLTSDCESESPKSKNRTEPGLELTDTLIMNYKTVRLVSTFGSGNCLSSFESSPNVETAAVSSFWLTHKWKLRTRFQFWGVSTFGPRQCCKQNISHALVRQLNNGYQALINCFGRCHYHINRIKELFHQTSTLFTWINNDPIIT